ncbi:MAG: hypothetical protein EBU88_09380 [Acidobacteria bacterium]|nr:hypothetical protein [Acidobacteriota bacterium]
MHCTHAFRLTQNLKSILALIVVIVAIGVAWKRQAVMAQDSVAAQDLKGLQYRLVGPAWGGRVSRVIGVAGTPIFYATTAGGGVWKSVDHGFTWQSTWESPEISSIGSIAIAPSDANVIYVGSGEANIRGNVAAGNGIYKSIDAGKTWEHVWKQEGQIGTMVVHPGNPNIAYAAVLGHAFGPNPERGVYRTIDGGKSWQQILRKDDQTGASDVAIDPSNPNIVFAGLWQARRYPWDLQSGGPGSGLYASRDGGTTWKQLKEKGLPEGIWGKVGIAVAPSDGRRVYALIEADKGGLFRSDDGGESWQLINASRSLRQRAWYYTTITVHPDNPNEVWFPSVPMLRTIDGGKSLETVRGIHHGDHHDVWFDPTNPKRMISGNDGGVDISSDGGRTWMAPALPISQFYHVAADNRHPFSVAGSMQDIGTAQGPSHSLRSGGIRNTDWYGVGGGEAGWVVSDTLDPNIVYAGEYGGIFTVYDHRTGQVRNVSVYPEDPSGHGAADFEYRFQWTAPIHVSPHNSKVVYHGGNFLFKTVDGGQTWTRITQDLTRNDKSKQQWAGGPITGDNTGVETYCTIFAVAESPVQRDLIWVGSDDGLVHISRDGGKNWKRLKLNLPTVAVHDLAVKGNTLVVGTHGRSIWAFDHLNVLREMTPQVKERAVYLFNVTDATRWQLNRGPADKFAGQNPPDGAVIHYWLKEAPKTDISIEIFDDGGRLVTTLSSKRRSPIGYSDNTSGESSSINASLLSKTEGLNQVVWNLHHSGAELIENGKLDFGGPVFGPKAIPGVYTIRLKVDGQEQSSTLRLHPDPRVTLSAADYKLQLETSLAIRDDVSRLSLLVRQLRSIRQQLAARNQLLRQRPTATDLVRDAESLIRKLDELEEQMHNPKAEVVYDILAFKGGAKLYSRIAFLHDVSSEGDGPTPQGVRTVYAQQKRELDSFEVALRGLISELGALNVRAKQLDLPHILHGAPRTPQTRRAGGGAIGFTGLIGPCH